MVRRPGGALAYAVYAVGTTRALTDSTFPTDHTALLGYSNGQAIQLTTAAEVCSRLLHFTTYCLSKKLRDLTFRMNLLLCSYCIHAIKSN